ncbi:MAG TPA: arsenite methyltransferase [Longimicrobiales bacterium]|nr:arsenite methyltransferase [Longimicrobiales bacterium]
MTRTTPTPDTLRATVRDKYASVARGDTLSCCGPGSGSGSGSGSGCGGDGRDEVIDMIGDAYAGVDGYVAEADLKLGCGLPVEHAGLAPGQTVLDLGAGAGLDAFVARRIVGDDGRVLGVDFTPEMVEKARANAEALGYDNVRFEHGDIESLPFADASVDVVISNCVLNLVPDKDRAFREMRRVLRPGGHFCVSDIVSDGELPAAVRASAELHAGCVAGAMEKEEYLGLLRAAGFDDVEVVVDSPVGLPEGLLPDGAPSPLRSVTVRGVVRHAARARDTLADPTDMVSRPAPPASRG